MTMKKKVIWFAVSCLMALSLVMASCGPAEEEAEVEMGEEEVEVGEEEIEVGEEEIEVGEEEVILSPDVPKYGGIYYGGGGDPVGFDPCYFLSFMMVPNMITTEGLLIANWAKGPAGTGEVDWTLGHLGRAELLTGGLAESYEMPDDETIIWHIRQGVHWWDKPPVNGREFTAYDAEWSLNLQYFECPRSVSAGGKPEDRIISITALDKYTLEYKVPSHNQGKHVIDAWGTRIYPPEVVEAHGDMKDWKNMVGTGAYMITDYVVGSSMTYERNPNYWQYDPVHPENQLPYLDGMVDLNIPDVSSAAAAFRTGKIDMRWNVDFDEYEQFMQQCPDLKYNQQFAASTFLVQPCGRVDKPELPFHDVKVRQALNLAVNQQELVDDYYGGHAALLGYPALPVASHTPMYTPLEEMSEVVQELFDYKPEKAKQLLADAGYPSGFKTSIICTSAQADLLSIIKEYLLKVDVDMEIQPGEGGMVTAMVKGRDHEEMCMAMHYPFSIYNMSTVRVADPSNPSFWESEQTLATYDIVQRNLGKDDAKVLQALKDITPHILENAPYIFMPAPHAFTMWWPWVQNYHGETNVGSTSIGNLGRKYIWLDTALKTSMGY